MYTCRSDGGLYLFHSFAGLVLFLFFFLIYILLRSIYLGGKKKKTREVPRDMISEPYSA